MSIDPDKNTLFISKISESDCIPPPSMRWVQNIGNANTPVVNLVTYGLMWPCTCKRAQDHLLVQGNSHHVVGLSLSLVVPRKLCCVVICGIFSKSFAAPGQRVYVDWMSQGIRWLCCCCSNMMWHTAVRLAISDRSTWWVLCRRCGKYSLFGECTRATRVAQTTLCAQLL